MAKFLTKKKFSEEVEEEVYMKDISYMEAVVSICEKLDIDEESANKFLLPQIKSKIEAEARDLNFLPRRGKLLFT